MPSRERLDFIASKFEKKMQAALLLMFDEIKDRVTLDAVLSALQSGGSAGALALLDTLEQDVQAKLLPEFQQAYIDTGRMGIELIPTAAIVGTPQFNMLDPLTVTSLTNHNVKLVQQISNNTRLAIRQNLEANIIAGNNPLQTARDFRASLGLTAKQELFVRNYRQALESGDSRALRYALRDQRSDKMIQRLFEEGSGLPQERIDSLVENYRNRWIKFRSETIARTESLRATHMGQNDSMVQSVAHGAVKEDRLRKFWIYTKDEKTRASHRLIPSMNSEGVKVREPFRSPLGMIMYPHDPAASGANTIRCRCTFYYRLIEI